MSNEIDYVVGPETQFNQELARDLDCKLLGIDVVKFPDHEFKVVVKLDEEKFENKNVVVSMQLNRDSGLRQAEQFTELLFLTGYLAQMNAAVSISMPYLMFGRQDKFFEPGEGISVRYMLNALASAGAKKLITFEAHLQRKKGLLNLPGLNLDVLNVSAIPAIVDFISKHYKMDKNTVILAPDKTAHTSAKELADAAKLKSGYLNKKRLSATDVVVNGCSIPLKGKSVIIFDDIASTGGTLVAAVNEAKKLGAKETTCIVVHPVLAKTCFDRVAPVTDHFYGTNTIISQISKIDIIPLLAKAIQNA